MPISTFPRSKLITGMSSYSGLYYVYSLGFKSPITFVMGNASCSLPFPFICLWDLLMLMHINTFCFTRLPWISLSVLVHLKFYHDYSACAGSFPCLEGASFTELPSRLALFLPQVSSLSCAVFLAPSLPTFFSLCVLIALTFLCVHVFINFQDILGRGFSSMITSLHLPATLNPQSGL